MILLQIIIHKAYIDYVIVLSLPYKDPLCKPGSTIVEEYPYAIKPS